MGIDLCLFRARVGLYRLSGLKPRGRTQISKYEPHTKGTDIQYRTLLCGIYLICIVLLSQITVLGYVRCVQHLTSMADFDKLDVFDTPRGFNMCEKLQWSYTSTEYGAQYRIFSKLLILRGGDIEPNPGPTEDTQKILNAISESNNKLTAELNAARNEFRSELKSLKTELKGLKTKVGAIEEKCEELKKRVDDFEMSMDHFEYNSDYIYRELENLKETDNDRLEMMQQQLNNLEFESVKRSLRVFGLDETETESRNLTDIIQDEVLSSATTQERGSMSILSAKRVGNFTPGKPRMVIVLFEHFKDKMKLFKYRDELRAKNIRISNDLSLIQRKMIKKANEQGFRAYFKNGVFCTEPRSKNKNTKSNKKVVRTLDDRNREVLRDRQMVDVGDDVAGGDGFNNHTANP